MFVISLPLLAWGLVISNQIEFDDYIRRSTYVTNDSADGTVSETDISYFFGDTIFNYANYIEKDGAPVFNGNKNQILKTTTKYKTITLWQNDLTSEQLIIGKVDNLVVQNLSIEVVSGAKIEPPLVTVKKMNFIKSNKKVGTKYIPNGISYYPDELVGPNVEDMSKFPIQPFLIQTSTKNIDCKPGQYTYNLKITYIVNNIYRTKIIPITVEVQDKYLDDNENVKSAEQRFSYDGMISPTNFYKYGVQAFQSTNQSQTSKPDVPEYMANSDYYFDWMKFNSNYQPAFLNDEYQAMMMQNYQPLNYMNLQYGYASPYGNSYIRIYAKNKNNYANEEQYWSDIAQPTVDVLQNENIEWGFDFSGFDAYVKFLTKIGMQKVYVPVIPRGTDAIKFYYLFNDFKMDNEKFAPVSALKDSIIASSGDLTSAGEVFKKTLFRKLITALSEHVASMQQDDSYQTLNDQPIQVYYSFDETQYQIDCDFITEVVGTETVAPADIKKVLKNHVYVGWEYDDKFANDKNFKLQSLVDGNFDDITLQQREFIVDNFGTSSETKFEDIVNQRNAKGQVTRFYSSWNNFPAPYIAANPADAAWGPLVAYRLNLNGFTRFAFEGYQNNVSEISEDNSATKEPGDAYLIYPGTGEGENWSLRLQNAIESYEMVMKLKQLFPDGIASNTNESGGTPDTQNLLSEISMTSDATRLTEYQWNLNYYNDTAIEFNNGDNVSTQIEKIKNYILKL
jgi:hypothetical protein